MERPVVRIGLAIGCACLAAAGLGCESIRPAGHRRAEPPAGTPSAFFDEFLDQDDAPAEGSPSKIFKNNRLPGGLSAEAREIERNSFNIYN